MRWDILFPVVTTEVTSKPHQDAMTDSCASHSATVSRAWSFPSREMREVYEVDEEDEHHRKRKSSRKPLPIADSADTVHTFSRQMELGPKCLQAEVKQMVVTFRGCQYRGTAAKLVLTGYALYLGGSTVWTARNAEFFLPKVIGYDPTLSLPSCLAVVAAVPLRTAVLAVNLLGEAARYLFFS
jgi:hypothetical protein